MTSRTERNPMKTSVSPQQMKINQYINEDNKKEQMVVPKNGPDSIGNSKYVFANENEQVSDSASRQSGGISSDEAGVDGTGEAEAGVD